MKKSIDDLIRDFCKENHDKYSVYENYSGKYMFGKKCLGVVVEQNSSYMEFLMQLTSFLNKNDADDADLKLEGIAVDELGLDTIVYFPNMEVVECI